MTSSNEEIRDAVTQYGEPWDERWEAALRLDPAFIASYAQLAAVPWTKNHLDDKVKSLVALAVSANSTHLYAPGTRTHIRRAFEAGAGVAEITEVLQLTASLGIHAMNIGVPILVDVLRAKGLRTEPRPLNPQQERLKAKFVDQRGYWHEFWNETLELDPEMFSAYTDFSSYPWRNGPLEPKIKEFIYIAFDVSATHLYVGGLRLHIENAVDYGATAEEILEVMEIASQIGMHGLLQAAPILQQEAGVE